MALYGTVTRIEAGWAERRLDYCGHLGDELMVTDLAVAPTVAPIYRWRVTIDRADAVVPLRDYFRRLALSAEICAPTVVEIAVEDPMDHDVEEYVACWQNVNGIALHLAPTNGNAKPTPLLVPRPWKPGLPRLGELLIGKGMISEEELAWALGEARATNQLLGIVLLRERMIFEDELARTLSEQLSIPYISIMRVGVDPSVVRGLPSEVGAAVAAIPIRMDDGCVQVGFADPTDPEAEAAVREHLPSISLAVAVLSDIKMAWQEFNRRFR
jgi:hypothetical protein